MNKEFHALPYKERRAILDKVYTFLHTPRKKGGPGQFQGHAWNDLARIAEVTKAGHYHSLLDYGCGEPIMYKTLGHRGRNGFFNSRNNLRLKRNFKVTTYDPFSHDPDVRVKPDRTFDLVVCNDVLEHLLEEEVDSTLDEIFGYARKAVWVNISTKAASKALETEEGIIYKGQSVHTCIKPERWWIKKLEKAELRTGRALTLHIHFEKG